MRTTDLQPAPGEIRRPGGDSIPYERRLAEDFDVALAEGSAFFEGGGAVQQALRRLATRLDELAMSDSIFTESVSPPRTPRRRTVPILPLVAALFVVSAVFGLGVLLWSAGGGFGFGGTVARTISPGMTAPDFTLPTADGRNMHLADYRGRAVFLAFVPSWEDAKTVAEVRSLREATPQFDMAGAKVMVVGPDSGEKAKKLHDAERLPFPVLLDRGGDLAKRFGVPAGYRTTFVVTPKGAVKYRVGDTVMDPEHHGKQLFDVSKCCMDEVVAARAHGIGKTVGDYSLPRADAGGRMETVFGDGRQKATAVLFLSTRCPCSNSYNGRVKEWAARYTARGVRFVGVYANQDESLSDIAAHAKANGFTFPVMKDDRALCADHFGAGVTPECFVLDARNTLRYAGRLDDSRDAAEVKSHDLPVALDAVLAGGTPLAETRAFGCGIVR
jgi:peroxiredoxin Q/BCP